MVAKRRGAPGAVMGYEDIAEESFGKLGRLLISSIIYVELFGTCCLLFILEVRGAWAQGTACRPRGACALPLGSRRMCVGIRVCWDASAGSQPRLPGAADVSQHRGAAPWLRRCRPHTALALPATRDVCAGATTCLCGPGRQPVQAPRHQAGRQRLAVHVDRRRHHDPHRVAARPQGALSAGHGRGLRHNHRRALGQYSAARCACAHAWSASRHRHLSRTLGPGRGGTRAAHPRPATGPPAPLQPADLAPGPFPHQPPPNRRINCRWPTLSSRATSPWARPPTWRCGPRCRSSLAS